MIMNKQDIESWIADIAEYEPLVADKIREYIDNGTVINSPAILWLKARREVAGDKYSVVSVFSNTRFDGRR